MDYFERFKFDSDVAAELSLELLTNLYHYKSEKNYPRIDALRNYMYDLAGLGRINNISGNGNLPRKKAITIGSKVAYDLLPTAQPSYLSGRVHDYLKNGDKKTFNVITESIAKSYNNFNQDHPETSLIVSALKSINVENVVPEALHEDELAIRNLASSAFIYTLKVFDVIAFNES